MCFVCGFYGFKDPRSGSWIFNLFVKLLLVRKPLPNLGQVLLLSYLCLEQDKLCE